MLCKPGGLLYKGGMVPNVALRFLRRAVFLAGVFIFTHAIIAKDVSAEFRARVDSAINKVRPALVRIRVVSTDYNDGREVKYQAVEAGRSSARTVT